jgi:hypothetical protein
MLTDDQAGRETAGATDWQDRASHLLDQAVDALWPGCSHDHGRLLYHALQTVRRGPAVDLIARALAAVYAEGQRSREAEGR